MDQRTASQAFASFKKLVDTEAIEAHLASFEEVARQAEIPRDRWVTFLTPLLDDQSAAFRNSMPPDTRADYDAVKKDLLELHGHNRNHYRNQWTGASTNPTTFQQVRNHLNRVYLAWKELEPSIQDWAVREQFLKIIEPEVSKYVAMQDPQTSKKAQEIADLYRS